MLRVVPAELLRDQAIRTVSRDLAAGREHAVRLGQEAGDVLGPQMLEHLSREDEVDGAVRHRRQVTERPLEPLDTSAAAGSGARRERLDADVPLHGRRIVLVEPFEVPRAGSATVEHRPASRGSR